MYLPDFGPTGFDEEHVWRTGCGVVVVPGSLCAACDHEHFQSRKQAGLGVVFLGTLDAMEHRSAVGKDVVRALIQRHFVDGDDYDRQLRDVCDWLPMTFPGE